MSTTEARVLVSATLPYSDLERSFPDNHVITIDRGVTVSACATGGPAAHGITVQDDLGNAVFVGAIALRALVRGQGSPSRTTEGEQE